MNFINLPRVSTYLSCYADCGPLVHGISYACFQGSIPCWLLTPPHKRWCGWSLDPPLRFHLLPKPFACHLALTTWLWAPGIFKYISWGMLIEEGLHLRGYGETIIHVRLKVSDEAVLGHLYICQWLNYRPTTDWTKALYMLATGSLLS